LPPGGSNCARPLAAQNKRPVTMDARAKWTLLFQEESFPRLIAFISFIWFPNLSACEFNVCSSQNKQQARHF
jgi:hypothetical protein